MPRVLCLPEPDRLQDVTILFCVFAVIGAMVRTAIRFHNGQPHIVDESLLLFACSCLVAATVMLYLSASPLYGLMMAEAAEKANPGLSQEIPIDSFTEVISKIERYSYPFGALIWSVVFSVKFCYLHFFRFLIDRQRSLVNFWKVTMVINLIAAVFNICASFEACPEFGDRSCESLCYDYTACVFIE